MEVREILMQLGDTVIVKTGDGDCSGRIVGRTLEGEPKFDVRTDKEILVNVIEKHVQLVASTAKSTPPATPQRTDVSQSLRENSYATAETEKQVA